MNKLEKTVYDILKYNPNIKIFVRNFYQSLLDFLPKTRFRTENEFSVYENFFFGFHDINPFSGDNKWHLANRYFNNKVYPKIGDPLEIGMICLESGKFKKIDESFTWNFHKGCRMQWRDNRRLIFNFNFNNNRYHSREIDYLTLEKKDHPFPIDSVSNNGKYCTSFSYGRLQYLMPGYGYLHKDFNSNLKLKSPSNTGFYIYDLETEEEVVFFSIESLVLVAGKDNLLGNNHFFVTHSLFSNDDKKVSFMLRWTNPMNNLKRSSLLFVYDLESKKLNILPTETMVSHYIWYENKILAYARKNSIDGHYLFDLSFSSNINYYRIEELNSDGHQTASCNKEIIIDSYPNSRRIQKLYYLKGIKSKPRLIGEFYHPKSFQSSKERGHICVDLHPRLSKDGSLVSFDSAFNNNRNLCIMKL